MSYGLTPFDMINDQDIGWRKGLVCVTNRIGHEKPIRSKLKSNPYRNNRTKSDD